MKSVSDKILNRIFLLIFAMILAVLLIRTCSKSMIIQKQAEMSLGKFVVSVKYRSPLKNKTKIFGEQVPYGIVWRTGTNEATIINFSENCKIEGKLVKKGLYSLWAIPEKDEWTVILNREIGQWGTNYDPDKDYLRFKAKAIKSQEEQNNLHLYFARFDAKITMFIHWENTVVYLDIKPN